MGRAVDQLFAQWAGPGSPGASIAVIQNGKIIYSQSYGAANLEHGVPNTPATVFDLASVSKQFTAFAIYLLVQDENCLWMTTRANTFRSYMTSAR